MATCWKARLTAGLLGLLGCGAAVADTTLVYDAGDAALTVRVRPDEVRIDSESRRWQLFRRSEQAIYAVDPERKAYMRMDADTGTAIRAQMQALRERMERRIAELPPAQRDTARAALSDQVPGMDGGQGKAVIERADRQARVAGRACEIFVVRRGGEAREELCVASREALGMSAEAFATVASMFELMSRMFAGTGLDDYVGLPYLELSGMPIRYRSADNGRKRTLSRVSHETLSDLVFEIPPGYRARRPDSQR